MQNNNRIILIGLGNQFRGDDGVGLYIARMVSEQLPEIIEVIDGVPDGYALLDSWDNSSRVYIFDCAVSGKTPGTIFRFDALNKEIPTDYFDGFSTHSISLVDALKMARVMNRLPRSIIVYGIEGKEYSAGDRLSPEVRQSADKLADVVIREIKSLINNNEVNLPDKIDVN